MYRGIGYIQEQTREEERKNTEREKARADALEKELDILQAKNEEMQKIIDELKSKNN